MDKAEPQLATHTPPAPMAAPAPADAAGAAEAKGRQRLQLRGLKQDEMLEKRAGANGRKDLQDRLELAEGVQTAATAGQLGDYFQYVLDTPVTVARQKSALLPILNQEIDGQRVSIYNEQTYAKFPLLGLKFKNATGQHLMQGPLTVFDGSAYAGDARIPDVQPGEERLLSYAIDLGTEVEPVVENPRQTLTKVKITKGILQTTTRVVESKTYKVKNRSEQDRTLLIEHPYRPEFWLTSKEKPVERARDVYRFEVKVPAGQNASETVTEERDLFSELALTNTDDQSIRIFLRTNAASPDVHQALQKAVELKGVADRTRQDLTHTNQQLNDIERDQMRIRANLKETPTSAAAYQKYLTKLDQQEGEIDKLREKIKQLQDDELAQRKAYEAYLANLTVE